MVLLGRHCSLTPPEYLVTAVERSLAWGANTLTFFLSSPRGRSQLRDVEVLRAQNFRKKVEKLGWNIKKIVVHGPYIINLANTLDKGVFSRSVGILIEEMELMAEIGLQTLVVHVGSFLTATLEEGLEQVIRGLDSIFESVPQGFIALETASNYKRMAGNFEHLSYIIDRVKQKERVKVCWDTCHLYAAGYDVKNRIEDVIKEFDSLIGISKLVAIHINDSLYEIGEGRDRHANIGQGTIGTEALKRIVHHPKLVGIPKLLETPFNGEREAAEEIRLLKGN